MRVRNHILVSAWSAAISVSAAGLTQKQTNGNSVLGTLEAPVLQAPNPSNWGGKTIETTNVYTNSPNTGRERHYTFRITREFLSPDGVNASMLVVNGAFPGPTIEANWGDTFVITVQNNIRGPEAGTSLHWHGLIQRDTPWMDGVPSVTQCPIAPGGSFTYRFKADRPGTSWWHGHYAAQTAAGLHGAMIIHGPPHKGAEYDVDLGPVFLEDHYHIDYRKLLEGYTSVPLQLIFSDSNLINGKGTYDCSKTTRTCTPDAGYSKFKFQSGKRHLLRLINGASEALQHFTIDSHEFTVVEMDFVPIKPFKTNKITLSPGQRANIIVKAKGKPTDSVWMRADIDPLCAAASNPKAQAAIYYERANTKSLPKSTATPYSAVGCATDELSKTVPVYAMKPPARPAADLKLDITVGFNASGNMLWYMNNSTFFADTSRGLLLDAANGKADISNPLSNVWNLGSNSSVRITMRNFHITPHPMHLHGHDFWVLAEGHGDWDGKVVNPNNPIRRDTHQLLPMDGDKPGYAVIQWELNNPGVWAFHCHIFSHSSLGFYINMLERPKDIKGMRIPDAVKNTCTAWNKYGSTHGVDQPDSGAV